MAPHVILSARRRLTEYLKRNARTAAGGSLLCGEGRNVLQRQRIRTHLRLEIGSDSFSLVWMFITILCQIKKSECPYEHSDWCARRDLNPYVINTRPSNVPVCQFQHARISVSDNYYIIFGILCQSFSRVKLIFLTTF